MQCRTKIVKNPNKIKSNVHTKMLKKLMKNVKNKTNTLNKT